MRITKGWGRVGGEGDEKRRERLKPPKAFLGLGSGVSGLGFLYSGLRGFGWTLLSRVAGETSDLPM